MRKVQQFELPASLRRSIVSESQPGLPDAIEPSGLCKCLNSCWLNEEQRQQGRRCLVACWHS